MPVPVRYLLHLVIVAIFVPLAAITIGAEYDLLRWPAETIAAALFFTSLPYVVAIKLYPFRAEWIGMALSHRLPRILIATSVPLISSLATAYCYGMSLAGESVVNAILPLSFYAGGYFFFKKYWETIFDKPQKNTPDEPPSPVTDFSSVPEVTNSESIEVSPPATFEKQPALFGIGGWLAFFAVIALMQPLWLSKLSIQTKELLSLSGRLRTDILYILNTLHLVFGYGAIAQSVFAHILGQAIIDGAKIARRLAFYYFATSAILLVAPYFYIMTLPSNIQTEIIKNVLPGTIGGAFWIIVWFLYFKFSKRVSNTYKTRFPIQPKTTCLWLCIKIVLAFGTVISVGVNVSSLAEIRF